MAKPKRKARKPKTGPDAEPPVDEPVEEQGPEGGDFFKSLSRGLKAAGQAAERFARMGVSAAELEKLKLELRVAQARLGESVLKCWDAAPDIGVTANDPAVKEPARAVKELRRRIREIEKHLTTLRGT